MAVGYKTLNSGRKPNTPNLITRTMRESLQIVANDYLTILSSETSPDRIKLSLEVLRIILPYILPKFNNSVEIESPVIVSIHQNI